MFTTLVRRIFACQAALVIAVAVLMALGGIGGLMRVTSDEAELGRGAAALLWAGALACVCGLAIAGLASLLLARKQVADVCDLFLDALPSHRAGPQPKGAARKIVPDDIARAFGELLDQASKDQAQLISIISSMSDGLIATDHQQRILITNSAATDLLAFVTPEGRGKLLWDVVPLEAVRKAVTEVSLTGLRKTIRIGPVNGRWLDVTVTRLPLRPAGFIILAHDVTEATRYEDLRKEFVANVSHELRTPLAVIQGYVETLRDGAIDHRERALQYLDTVGRHTEQLTLLIDDLLSLSKLDSATGLPSAQPVQLGRVVAHVAELLEPAALKKKQELTIEVDPDAAAVNGNGEYLERAVSNLVENAIKYTAEGGQIHLSVRGGDGQVIVAVTDNGIGISPDDLPRIFERFYRVDRSRSRAMGGTGLGLSIVKHIAQAHQGSVEVQSTPGQGSSFRLVLPAA